MWVADLAAALQSEVAGTTILVAILATLVALSANFYGRTAARISREGGCVPNSLLELPDLLVTLFLGGVFTLLAVVSLLQPVKEPTKISAEQAIGGQLFLLILAGGIALFLWARRVPLGELIGFRHLSVPRAAIRALKLMVAAIPIVWAVSFLSVQVLPKQLAEEQQLVSMFRDVSKHGNWNGVIAVAVTGVLLAPPIEEFLFRAYFYGSLKRFVGFLPAAFLSSALFAFSHGNIASFPGLFVLALCFALAYEATGSLLVTMGMHALFNAGNLAMLFFVSRNGA